MLASLGSIIQSSPDIYAHSIAHFLDLHEILRLTATGSTSRSWTQLEGKLVVPCLGEEVPNDNPTWNFLVVTRRLHLTSLRAVKLKPKDLTSTVSFLAAALRLGVPLQELSLYGGFECLEECSNELVSNFCALFQGITQSKFMKRLSLSLCYLGPLFELGTYCDRINWGSLSALDCLSLWNCSLTDKSVQSLAQIFAARRAGPTEWIMSCPHKGGEGRLSVETVRALGDAVAAMQRLRKFVLRGTRLEHTGDSIGQGLGLALRDGRLESIEVEGISSESAVAIGLDMGLCAVLKEVCICIEADTIVAARAIIHGARSCRHLQTLHVTSREEDELPDDTACERLGSDVGALIACNQKLCELSVPWQFSCSALFARHVILAQAKWDRPESFDFVDHYYEVVSFDAGNLVGSFARVPRQNTVATDFTGQVAAVDETEIQVELPE